MDSTATASQIYLNTQHSYSYINTTSTINSEKNDNLPKKMNSNKLSPIANHEHDRKRLSKYRFIDEENEKLKDQIRDLEQALLQQSFSQSRDANQYQNNHQPLREKQFNIRDNQQKSSLPQENMRRLYNYQSNNQQSYKRDRYEQKQEIQKPNKAVLSPDQKYQCTIENYRNQIKHMREYLREIELKSTTSPNRKNLREKERIREDLEKKKINDKYEMERFKQKSQKSSQQPSRRIQDKENFDNKDIKQINYDEKLNRTQIESRYKDNDFNYEVLKRKESESEFKRDYWKRKNINTSLEKVKSNLTHSLAFDQTNTTIGMNNIADKEPLIPSQIYQDLKMEIPQQFQQETFQQQQQQHQSSTKSHVSLKPSRQFSIPQSRDSKQQDFNYVKDSSIQLLSLKENEQINHEINPIMFQNQDLKSVQTSKHHSRGQSISFAQDLNENINPRSRCSSQRKQEDNRYEIQKQNEPINSDYQSQVNQDNLFILDELRKLRLENQELREMMLKQRQYQPLNNSIYRDQSYDKLSQTYNTVNVLQEHQVYTPLRSIQNDNPIIIPTALNKSENRNTFETLQSQDDQSLLLNLKPCYIHKQDDKSTIDTQSFYPQMNRGDQYNFSDYGNQILSNQTTLTPNIDQSQIQKEDQVTNQMTITAEEREKLKEKRKAKILKKCENHLQTCKECNQWKTQMDKYQSRIDKHLREVALGQRKKSKQSRNKKPNEVHSRVFSENVNVLNQSRKRSQDRAQLRLKTPDRFAEQSQQKSKSKNYRDTSRKSFATILSQKQSSQSNKKYPQKSNYQKYTMLRQKSGHNPQNRQSTTVSNLTTIDHLNNSHLGIKTQKSMNSLQTNKKYSFQVPRNQNQTWNLIHPQ